MNTCSKLTHLTSSKIIWDRIKQSLKKTIIPPLKSLHVSNIALIDAEKLEALANQFQANSNKTNPQKSMQLNALTCEQCTQRGLVSREQVDKYCWVQCADLGMELLKVGSISNFFYCPATPPQSDCCFLSLNSAFTLLKFWHHFSS